MDLIHAMNELATGIGMKPVEADETGGFTLLFDGVQEISFAPDGNNVVFHAPVGEADRLDREGLLSLLEASLLGAGTGGAAFGLHRAAGELVLWKRYGEFSGRADLEAAIGKFLGLVLEWKRRLAEGDFAASAAAEFPPSSPPAFHGSFLQV